MKTIQSLAVLKLFFFVLLLFEFSCNIIIIFYDTESGYAAWAGQEVLASINPHVLFFREARDYS